MEYFKQKLVQEIDKYISSEEITLEIPPDPKFGDFALPCFPFAKELKRSPVEIASDLKGKIKADFIERTETKGPYLNFFLDKHILADSVIREVEKEKKGYGKISLQKQKIMVEFSQANTHKAFHVGHIRGTSLGESLSRILEFSGKDVIRANYQGDTGMHVAKWIWCYQRFHQKEKIRKDESWFAKIYVDAIKKLSENEDYQEEVEELNRKLDERSDRKLNDLWKKTRKLCLEALETIYTELNTHFDEYFFESNLEEEAKMMAKELIDKGIAEISEKATIIDLKKYDLGVFLLLRGDGTVLYGGKDIVLAVKKFRQFEIDESIYVVGKEQEHYFSQVFKVLELLKIGKRATYVPVSLVKLPWGKMSSRTGDNILYSEFREELIGYAQKQIEEKWRNLDKEEVRRRALVISTASMKYSMLKQNPNKEIIFNKEEAMRFEGDTGPYLLYSYARAASILKRSEKKRSSAHDIHEKEMALIKKIAGFSEAVREAAQSLNPGIIANYAFRLASSFNEFYTSCRVIGENEEGWRIRIVDSFKTTLGNALDLLAISYLEEM